MVQSSGRGDYVWFDGKIVPQTEANVSLFTHALSYGSSVFEGERAYNGIVFKSTQHSQRLIDSAKILDFDVPFTAAELDAAKTALIAKNKTPDIYFRALAWRGDEALGVSAQNNKIHVALLALKWGNYFDAAQRMKGIKLDMAEYRRPDPMTAPSRAKAAGLYMICTISKHKAERKGYADALMLDWQGRVAECTGANVFFIKNGVVHTPIADCFLDGLTRQTVIEMLKKRGIKLEERRIMPDELESFEECFVTGSAAEIVPVSEIGSYNFVPGAISKTMIDDYTALTHGTATAQTSAA
ncbi:MAG: branched-chain amino acid aminotransferase [Pseudomonadota bacterium]